MASGKVDMNTMANHFDILFSLHSALKTVGISVCLVALWLVFFNISQAVKFRKLRCNWVAMSHQRGTSRRTSLGRGKAQCGYSLQVAADYEHHISSRVRILVEAWEGRVLNQKLPTSQDGSQINHY